MGDSCLLRIKGGWNIRNVELESNTGLVKETGVGALLCFLGMPRTVRGRGTCLPRKGRAKSPEGSPVCLLFKNDHFRAVVPKSNQVEHPSDWLNETPIVPRGALRGAGKRRTSQAEVGSPHTLSVAKHSD